MATSAASVDGDRNVVITAEANKAVIIPGDGNTVHMHQSADGALLAHESGFRGGWASAAASGAARAQTSAIEMP